MPNKIPVTIITGFLGSGKTTLLNRLLNDADSRKTAVIVNEFGEIGLDHELIESSNDFVTLLANGCLCCSIKGDLVNTLLDLYQKQLRGLIPRFDQVVIETSGLAEPSPIIEVLVAEPKVQSVYGLGQVVATVDSVNGLETINRFDQSVKQVALADKIVVTKTDLIPICVGLEEELRRINPQAVQCHANEVTFEWFDRQKGAANLTIDLANATEREYEAQSKHSAGHNHNIHRFSYVQEKPWDLDTFRLFTEGLAANAGPDLLRIKGLINILDAPGTPAVVHGAQQLVHSIEWLKEWPSADHRTRLVFITFNKPAAEIIELIEYIESFAQRTKLARQVA